MFYQHLCHLIKDNYERANGILSYGQMAINLNRENKFRVNEKRTLRLMRILHIKSVCRKTRKNYIKSTPAAYVSIHVRFLYDEQVLDLYINLMEHLIRVQIL
jgi:hypothetical protein